MQLLIEALEMSTRQYHTERDPVVAYCCCHKWPPDQLLFWQAASKMNLQGEKKSKYDRAHWFIRQQENMFFLFITPASFFSFWLVSPSFCPFRIFTSLFASDSTEAELSSWVILLNLVCLIVYQFNPLFPKGLFWEAIILSPIVSLLSASWLG